MAKNTDVSSDACSLLLLPLLVVDNISNRFEDWGNLEHMRFSLASPQCLGKAPPIS
jgi:hypothetical protein